MTSCHRAATVLATLGLASVLPLPFGLGAGLHASWSSKAHSPAQMLCMCFPVGYLSGARVLLVINEYIKLTYYVVAY